MKIVHLDPYNPEQAFPALHHALTEPNGLLALGGCLSTQRIINAYQQGIFPWYNPGEPILWWSPNPRLVLFPNKIKISRSLHKTLRKQLFDIRYDNDFKEVMMACAAPRHQASGTWISEEMLIAYQKLHENGVGHCVEAWQDGELVGGLYGLAIGRVFFGESMFHTRTDASKVVLVHLTQMLSDWNFQLIDCQVSSEHLLSLGAEEISRQQFQVLVKYLCSQRPHPQAWTK